MKSKTKLLFTAYFFLVSLFVVELVYIEKYSDFSNQNIPLKVKVVELVSLPNLAIASNENYLRHKSYANIFDMLPYDGEVQTNSKMSFVY
jgi:hypothetical protein